MSFGLIYSHGGNSLTAGGGVEREAFVAVELVFLGIGVDVVAIVVRAPERPDISRVVKHAVGVVVSARSGGEINLYQEIDDGDSAYDEGK